MLYKFTIHEVLLNKLNEIKVDVYEQPLYKKHWFCLIFGRLKRNSGTYLTNMKHWNERKKGFQNRCSTTPVPPHPQNHPVTKTNISNF